MSKKDEAVFNADDKAACEEAVFNSKLAQDPGWQDMLKSAWQEAALASTR